MSSVNNKKIEIMNPDDYITGTHDQLNPANQEENEPLSELEELQEWNSNLLARNVKMRQQLKKLAEFEQTIITFGHLTYEQQTEKNEILNQYLK